MEALLSELRQWGCDIDGAMARFMNNKELYVSFCGEVAKDENFQLLEDSLKEHNVHKAFEAAHSLKGVLGNMGLTPMYKTIGLIVEPLRVGKDVDLSKELKQLLDEKKRFEEIVAKHK